MIHLGDRLPPHSKPVGLEARGDGWSLSIWERRGRLYARLVPEEGSPYVLVMKVRASDPEEALGLALEELGLTPEEVVRC